MTITDWPKADRPREKLLLQGEEALTDAELIAIFLNTGTRGKTALDIAKALLAKHGSLKTLLSLPPTLLHQPGLGAAKYAALKAAAELGRRCLQDPLPPGTLLNNSLAVQRFLESRLRHQASEIFACLFLDSHLRLIRFEALFHGTHNQAAVYPREIVKQGLIHNAAKIILAHNHPSGHPQPSQADKDVTQHIKQALALIDMVVIDHIIIGNPENYSFAETGLL